MNTIEKKSVNAGKFVTKQEVDTLIRSYKQERWADNSERMGQADSLSVWFTVEEVEGFLAKVKANGGNGVRFHFGVFSAENATVPEFEGRQTLVMVGKERRRPWLRSLAFHYYWCRVLYSCCRNHRCSGCRS